MVAGHPRQHRVAPHHRRSHRPVVHLVTHPSPVDRKQCAREHRQAVGHRRGTVPVAVPHLTGHDRRGPHPHDRHRVPADRRHVGVGRTIGNRQPAAGRRHQTKAPLPHLPVCQTPKANHVATLTHHHRVADCSSDIVNRVHRGKGGHQLVGPGIQYRSTAWIITERSRHRTGGVELDGR